MEPTLAVTTMTHDMHYELTKLKYTVDIIDIKVLPRRCALTHRWLWQEPAVRLTRTTTGPGTPVQVIHWVDPKEYTMYMLKHSST